MRGYPAAMGFREVGLPLLAVLMAQCGAGGRRGSTAELAEASLWGNAPWQDQFVAADGEAAPELSTRLQAVGAGGALHVRFDGPAVGPGDTIDVVIDPIAERRRSWRYTLAEDGTCFEGAADEGGEFPGGSCDPSTGHTSSVRDGSWRSEIAIPFARVGGSGEWRWRVVRTVRTDRGVRRLVWAPSEPVLALGTGTRMERVQVGSATLDWHLSRATFAVAGDAEGVQTFWPRARLTSLASAPLKVRVCAGKAGQSRCEVGSELDLAPGASEDVVLPPFTSKPGEPDAPPYLSVSEVKAPGTSSGVAADVDVASHVDVRVTNLPYRGNIYPSQSIRDLAYDATLSATTVALASAVDVQLVSETGAILRSARLLPSKDVRGDLEVQLLEAGSYILRVRALRADGGVVAEASRPVRKLGTPAGNEVRVDEAGNILVDGRPCLFIGWYGDVPREDPRGEVLALQNLRSELILTGADPRPVRESFARGVYSIVSVEPLRVRGVSGDGAERKAVLDEIGSTSGPSPATLAPLRALVQAVSNEPGLLGYYLADEPEIHGYRSDYLESEYRELTKLDPYHPVIVTNMTTGGMRTHGVRASDILNPDPYSSAPDAFVAYGRTARSIEHPGQALMATLWQAAWGHHSEFDDHGPNPYVVIRAQYLSAIALGARGFTGYITPFFMAEPTLRYGLPFAWREMRFLEPALLTQAPAEEPIVDTSGDVSAWLRSVNGETFVVAFNSGGRKAEAAIRHRSLEGVREVVVVGEKRVLAVTQGSFRDSFEPGTVHLYSTAQRAADLASNDAVEAEIAARSKAGPGPDDNLREPGTRVYSAKGSTPPFPRYYEYVTNGITDDEGWHHPSTGSWFEVFPTRAQTLGEIVVYTPNLRDFDLDLVDPGGVRHHAEIRENREEEVHVPVLPQVAAVSLRLTALRCRDDAAPGGPMVREIAAFRSPSRGAGVAWTLQASARRAEPRGAPRAGTGVAWTERFSALTREPSVGAVPLAWTFDPAAVAIGANPGGGVMVSSTAAAGYASLSAKVPDHKGARYLQARVARVEGEGYRFFSLNVGTPAQGTTRLVAHGSGLYTIDLESIRPSMEVKPGDELALAIQVAGSTRMPDGQVHPGPRFGFDWLRLVGDPLDALVASSPDGSALPSRLKVGDSVVLRVLLTKPADDVVVELRANPEFRTIWLDDLPYVRLERVGRGDGREWAARVSLAAGSERFDGTGSFPIVARAMISGGPLRETLTMIRARFE